MSAFATSNHNHALANTEQPEKAVAEDKVHKEGYLLKWTNYMKGFQRRYFVLDGRSLAYYRFAEDVREMRMCVFVLGAFA